MPKYFFRIADDGSTLETVALDLLGPAEARLHARAFGDALEPIGQAPARWKVSVSDHEGRQLFDQLPASQATD